MSLNVDIGRESHNWLSWASASQLLSITVHFPNITDYILTKLLEFINDTFNFIMIEKRVSTVRHLQLEITDCQDKLAKFIKLKAAINFIQNFK